MSLDGGYIVIVSYLKHYKEKFENFKNLLNKENPIIVEVGAHYGEDSLRFLEIFENPTLYCFEPDPRNVRIFKKYVLDSKIKLFEFALSDKNGEGAFFQSYDEEQSNYVPAKYDWIKDEDYKNEKLGNSGSSSLKKGYNKTLPSAIKVQTRRFDTWCSENNIQEIDLAWIDVQGAERDVLDGMGALINRVKYIWIEYGEKMYEGAMSRQETIEYFRSRGFKILDKYSSYSQVGDLLAERSD